jgi:hypothetical protein
MAMMLHHVLPRDARSQPWACSGPIAHRDFFAMEFTSEQISFQMLYGARSR